jgi:methylmalonyl-CoA mutase N-terminal domain/subunit
LVKANGVFGTNITHELKLVAIITMPMPFNYHFATNCKIQSAINFRTSGEIVSSILPYSEGYRGWEEDSVGVNKFVSPYPPITGLLKVNPVEAEKQKQRLIALKARRDKKAVTQSLNRLKEVASSKENTMPAILDCVESYATLGEICDVLREVFGEYRAREYFK